jgi:hypothetical protein
LKNTLVQKFGRTMQRVWMSNKKTTNEQCKKSNTKEQHEKCKQMTQKSCTKSDENMDEQCKENEGP